MASKQELIDKIEIIARRVYSAKTKDNTLGVSPKDVDFDKELFPILTKFPTLKTTIINLLTDQYGDFVKDIWWVAPRPTTFKIVLANNQFFYLIYNERSWVAKVEGKKYYLENISDEENASNAISRILSYGSKEDEEPKPEDDTIAAPDLTSVPAGGATPEDETVPEPEAETPPPPTEEVPEELPV
jgi:hypothetical protein